MDLEDKSTPTRFRQVGGNKDNFMVTAYPLSGRSQTTRPNIKYKKDGTWRVN